MKGALLAVWLAAAGPAGAVETRPLATWKGHTDQVSNAAFTADGAGVLSASDDYSLKLWEVKTGRVKKTIRGENGYQFGLVYYSGGTRSAAVNEALTFKLYDAAAGKTVAVFTGYDKLLNTLVLSPDGRTAAATAWDGELTLWDAATGKKTATLQSGDAASALGIAFSPDGKTLLSGHGDRTVRLWDAASGKPQAVWHGHKRHVLAVAFSPDGKHALSGGKDNTLRYWDAASGRTLAVWRGHTSYVYTLEFSPDGRRALSGGSDFTARLWDTASGELLDTLRGHQGGVLDVAFSPDGTRAVTASEDRTLKLWDLTGKSGPAPDAPDAVSYLPPPPGTPEERLGRLLFFDQRLSGDEFRDCASCHMPEKAYSDGSELSLGYPDTLYFRNTPSLLNLSGQKHLYWDGRFPSDDLASLIRDHIAEAHFMNADGRLIVEKLRQAPGYLQAFQEVYGTEPSYAKILQALTAFVRSLKSGEAPFDRFLAGDARALSRAARRGRQLFNGKGGCAACHSGPLLTDGGLHNRGVPENTRILTEPPRRVSLRRFYKLFGVKDYADLRGDTGLYAVTMRPEDRGKFKTPSLREAALTAPYMHNGMIATLAEAAGLMNPGLSRRERRDLAAFMESLTSGSPAFAYKPPPLPEYAVRPGKEHPPAGKPAPAPAASRREFPPLGPLPPVPVPDDNPLSDEKVELGRLLFFDPRLSGDGSTFCAACHESGMGWGDGSDLSLGYPGMLHWRNSQTLLNAAYYSKLEWDGAWPNLEEQARGAITSNINGNGDPEVIEERLAESPEYMRLFKRAFGVERPNFESVLKALASFQRAVPISRNVPFDRDDLSPAARKGRALFEGKAGCLRCHNGPLASDQGFHATGVPRNPAFDHVALRQVALRYQHVTRGVPEEVYRNADSDPGLYLKTMREEDIGKFRTASLRELKHTAPYMHNGTLATLAAVVDFYDRGGGDTPNKTPLLKPLRLTPQEKLDLIAFLESLSGDEILIEPPATPGPRISGRGLEIK
ncbi:MAG: cytochrome c peroxidase [Elusimicrobiota bacterium]